LSRTNTITINVTLVASEALIVDILWNADGKAEGIIF
jgi:hypothetical protein